ncbi:hypothetical protein SAMN05428642_103413 [Flaviramulus basaltis]|uniref:Uncharacterized protein n=1 Tax=Flaviramulus basaltis TaxID=369401 RepID=A0A1K2IN93_9FLAO|nr:hypothetical protein SAMN05428642_103413 [Flaviramulus basaltis]
MNTINHSLAYEIGYLLEGLDLEALIDNDML